jgi:hypothetical protein
VLVSGPSRGCISRTTLSYMSYFQTNPDPWVHVGGRMRLSERQALQRYAKAHNTSVMAMIREALLARLDEEQQEAGRERAAA